jgi:hypothetical protein
VGVLVFTVAAFAAGEMDVRAHAAKVGADAGTARRAVACLGGVLSGDATGSYLTLSDYPAQSEVLLGRRRTVVCGDKIPPFIPLAKYRYGFGLHNR